MTPFLCLVAMVYDGDTLTCRDGTRIRLAGINAQEMHGTPCPQGRPCPPMPARQARDTLVRMVLGKTLRCNAVGMSYRRVVADCYLGGISISCQMIQSQAAYRWDSYWAKYRLPRCRG